MIISSKLILPAEAGYISMVPHLAAWVLQENASDTRIKVAAGEK